MNYKLIMNPWPIINSSW